MIASPCHMASSRRSVFGDDAPVSARLPLCREGAERVSAGFWPCQTIFGLLVSQDSQALDPGLRRSAPSR